MNQLGPLFEKDLLDNVTFMQNRDVFIADLREIKKNRRIPLGPDISFYFENKKTIWFQIQEMLRIEQGGDSQRQEELDAYNPLIARVYLDGSKELIATMMIEINNPDIRQVALKKLCYIEDHLFLKIHDDCVIKASSIDPEGRTIGDQKGDQKTSAVHFLKFHLTSHQVESFKDTRNALHLISTHPFYPHTTTLSDDQKKALGSDL